MERSHATALAHQLLSLHGPPGWSFGFNRRKRALGLCRHHLRRIELSLHFTHANDEPAVRDTLLHEIAHALAGQATAHGPEWKRACRLVGAKPERTCRTAVMPLGKWRGTCPTCGRAYSRHRRPLRSRTYFCRHCPAAIGLITFQRLPAPAPHQGNPI